MEDFFESIKIRKAVGIYVLISIIVMIIGEETFLKKIDYLNFYFWMICINVILLLWFIHKIKKGNIKIKDLINNFKEQVKWSEIFKIIIMDMSFSMGFVYFLLGLLLKINPHLAYELLKDSSDTDTIYSLIYNCIGAVLLAPIVEELLFRGVIFHRLKKRYSIGKAIIISSIAFGIMHMELAMVGAFVTGVLLCLLYLKTKNILITMCTHFMNNFIATLIQSICFFMDQSSENEIFTQREIDFFIYIGLFVCLVAGYFVIRYIKNNWPKKVIIDEI